MREVVLDTETTGLDPASGDRIVEIGCVELVNHAPTGLTFHCYVNPERGMPAEAFAIHGLTEAFLKGHPTFAGIADMVLDYLGDAPIVAHNGTFDLAFLNMELERAGKPVIAAARLVDTLTLARRKHAGLNSLDALCERYRIDKTGRDKHGALLDAKLLARVYGELLDRQAAFDLFDAPDDGATVAAAAAQRPVPLAPRLTAADVALHRAFIADAIQAPIWNDYR